MSNSGPNLSPFNYSGIQYSKTNLEATNRQELHWLRGCEHCHSKPAGKAGLLRFPWLALDGTFMGMPGSDTTADTGRFSEILIW